MVQGVRFVGQLDVVGSRGPWESFGMDARLDLLLLPHWPAWIVIISLSLGQQDHF